MYSPSKGSGKFQESASGNMEAGMAGQATGSCHGQQGTGRKQHFRSMGRLSPKTTVCSANFIKLVGQGFRQLQRTVLDKEVVPLCLIKVVLGNRAW